MKSQRQSVHVKSQESSCVVKPFIVPVSSFEQCAIFELEWGKDSSSTMEICQQLALDDRIREVLGHLL